MHLRVMQKYVKDCWQHFASPKMYIDMAKRGGKNPTPVDLCAANSPLRRSDLDWPDCSRKISAQRSALNLGIRS